jgi:hypothetical protein
MKPEKNSYGAGVDTQQKGNYPQAVGKQPAG